MAIKFEGCKKPYYPKDTDEVRCEVHGVVTTWGALDSIQRLACEEGLDTTDDMPCLLLPKQTDEPLTDIEAKAFISLLSQKPAKRGQRTPQ